MSEPVMCQACARDAHKRCWQIMLSGENTGACCCECAKAKAAQRRVAKEAK